MAGTLHLIPAFILVYIIPAENSSSLAPTHTGFQIEVSLDANAKPPAAWTAKACGSNYQANQPVFRANLNQETLVRFKNHHKESINPYPLLSSLTFQEILIWG